MIQGFKHILYNQILHNCTRTDDRETSQDVTFPTTRSHGPALCFGLRSEEDRCQRKHCEKADSQNINSEDLLSSGWETLVEALCGVSASRGDLDVLLTVGTVRAMTPSRIVIIPLYCKVCALPGSVTFRGGNVFLELVLQWSGYCVRVKSFTSKNRRRNWKGQTSGSRWRLTITQSIALL